MDFKLHTRAVFNRMGDDWTVTPQGGAPAFTLRGILITPYSELLGGTVPGVSASQPHFSCMHEDLNGIAIDDTLTLAGDTYAVAFVPDAPELPSGRALLQLKRP